MKYSEIDIKTATELYLNAPTSELGYVADNIRRELHPDKIVTWIIDRNVNITNACFVGCRFCNFHVKPNDVGVYITSKEQYCEKIKELFGFGGDQLLLQGGMNPHLGLSFYKNLFKELKRDFPLLKLHALGPPEIVFLAKKESIGIQDVLKELVDSGLDSLPGAGAEILSDRVRTELSKGKCSVDEWLNVMRHAHKLNLPTSATMMFGHIETPEERIQHLFYLKQVQGEKPDGAYGFLSFIPWPFQDLGTVLREKDGVLNRVLPEQYIRLIAISRIVLQNIPNIQASWLTVGKETAQLCLHAGANDFGSIMIEENVVSSAGANYTMDAEGIQKAIIEAGFIPKKRNQKFEVVQ